MSINFQTFLEKTGYTPAYAARSVLYCPKSRPALLAAVLDLDVKGERTRMIYIVAGKKGSSVALVKTSSRSSDKPKPESRQLEIDVENTPERVDLC